jgi:hypothetical protein
MESTEDEAGWMMVCLVDSECLGRIQMLEEAMAAHTDDEVLQESGVQLLEALRDWLKDNEEEQEEQQPPREPRVAAVRAEEARRQQEAQEAAQEAADAAEAAQLQEQQEAAEATQLQDAMDESAADVPPPPVLSGNEFGEATKTVTATAADESPCIICKEDLDGAVCQLHACKHRFHFQCISPWLIKSSRACPLCKTDAMEFDADAVEAEAKAGGDSSVGGGEAEVEKLRADLAEAKRCNEEVTEALAKVQQEQAEAKVQQEQEQAQQAQTEAQAKVQQEQAEAQAKVQQEQAKAQQREGDEAPECDQVQVEVEAKEGGGGGSSAGGGEGAGGAMEVEEAQAQEGGGGGSLTDTDPQEIMKANRLQTFEGFVADNGNDDDVIYQSMTKIRGLVCFDLHNDSTAHLCQDDIWRNYSIEELEHAIGEENWMMKYCFSTRDKDTGILPLNELTEHIAHMQERMKSDPDWGANEPNYVIHSNFILPEHSRLLKAQQQLGDEMKARHTYLRACYQQRADEATAAAGGGDEEDLPVVNTAISPRAAVSPRPGSGTKRTRDEQAASVSEGEQEEEGDAMDEGKQEEEDEEEEEEEEAMDEGKQEEEGEAMDEGKQEEEAVVGEVMGEEEEAMAVAGDAVVGVGSVVQIGGLQSRPELNNTTGRVTMLVEATGSWRVKLDDSWTLLNGYSVTNNEWSMGGAAFTTWPPRRFQGPIIDIKHANVRVSPERLSTPAPTPASAPAPTPAPGTSLPDEPPGAANV